MEPTLDDLYDHATVEAIDSWTPGRGAEPARGWRAGATVAAVVASGLTGVREAVESEIEPEVAELRRASAMNRAEAVTVLFVPDDPAGTVAVVRPWLLRHPGPAILAAIA